MGQNHSSSNKLIIVGSVGAPFGVKGWLKINSYTEPKENILLFKKLYLIDQLDQQNGREQQVPRVPSQCSYPVLSILDVKESKNKFIVLLKGVEDRSKAATLTNKKIAIERKDLPELADSQYYWADLIGSSVYNLSHELLGIVDDLFATAANDVMVIKNQNSHFNNHSEYLIPYKMGEFVVSVDLPNKKIIVKWDLE